MEIVFKGICAFSLLVVMLCLFFFVWLCVREYRPEPIEMMEISSNEKLSKLNSENQLRILCWNIGYGGLGSGSDFFMDGGKSVCPADKPQVLHYLSGIQNSLRELEPDVALLQEVDLDSWRTYRIDETEILAMDASVHAMNYACDYVPFPIPPLGRIYSGVFTTTLGLFIEKAERISLPCPFHWPNRVANIKRCLLASYIPIEGIDKYLVAVNLHLEAYDSGEGKVAQTIMLKEFIEREYDKGNYVIAGGDFNQIFPNGLDIFPNTHQELWTPNLLEENILADGWYFAYDLNVPSCRLLNQPYDSADEINTQYYVIDGFMLSPNIELIAVEGVNYAFANSDHNPVQITVKLK